MSTTQIPRPYFLQEDKWATLIGGREWEQADDGWLEVTDLSDNPLASHAGEMAKRDVERYLSTEGPWFAQGGPSMLLTTVGRKSGEKRSVGANYLPYGGSWIVIGSLAGLPKPPQWALNLEQTPVAWVQIKEHQWEASSRMMSNEEVERFWPTLTSLFPLWQYFQGYCRREFKTFMLTPTKKLVG